MCEEDRVEMKVRDAGWREVAEREEVKAVRLDVAADHPSAS